MKETKYRVQLEVPLGKREGTMLIKRSRGKVTGWIEVLGKKNEFSGENSDNGQIRFSGTLETFMDTIPYTATGTVSGSQILLNMEMASGTYYSISGKEVGQDEKIL